MVKKQEPPLAKFIAEPKKITTRKSASLDMVYQIVLETEDPVLGRLGGELTAETMLDIEVRLP